MDESEEAVVRAHCLQSLRNIADKFGHRVGFIDQLDAHCSGMFTETPLLGLVLIDAAWRGIDDIEVVRALDDADLRSLTTMASLYMAFKMETLKSLGEAPFAGAQENDA